MSRIARYAVLAGVLSSLALGCSSDSSDQAATTVAPVEQRTPAQVKNQIFERAFTECASYNVERLAGKYNVAVKSEDTVATAVANAWTTFFKAGDDAVPEGRAGCLQGFDRK